MGCAGGKINMTAVAVKRSIVIKHDSCAVLCASLLIGYELITYK